MDDILITGNDPTLIHKFIHDLNFDFALKTLDFINYFLGFEGHHIKVSLLFTRTKYILNFFQQMIMSSTKPNPTPMYSTKKLSLQDSAPFEYPF